MIRLIATDLDDTLLDASVALTERSLKALRAAMDAGCGVALSSGRMIEATLPFALAIGVNAPMLLYNGAMVYDPNADETLYAARIPFETALPIVQWAEAQGRYIQLYPGKGYFCDEIRDCTVAYANQIRVPATPVHMPVSEWLAAHPSDMQKLLIIDTPEGADRVKLALAEAFPGAANYQKSKPHYLEISPRGVNKGRSLAILAEKLGLTADEVMAFGDGQNDVPMLAYAGAGYAMANACPEARAAAKGIAPRNTEDGVARVIEQYLAEGKIGRM